MRSSSVMVASTVLMAIAASFAMGARPARAVDASAAAAMAEEDASALRWYLSNSTGALRSVERWWEPGARPELLLHLPSGRPLPPHPVWVSERDTLQVVAVVAEGSLPPVLAVKSCPQVDLFRIAGSFAGLGGSPSASRGEARHALVPLGRPFRCGADELVYEVGPPGGPAIETRLRVRPVYSLSATAVLAFDAAIERSFGVVDHQVVASEDEVGPSVLLGFTWHPRGLDHERLTPADDWLNPFLAFDLEAPTEHFMIGLQLFPRRGLGLAVGASFHHVSVLDGYSPGDDFTGDGDVPTRKEWNDDSIGAFVGVALNSVVFDRVKGPWSAKSRRRMRGARRRRALRASR